jgi:uncharacterized membrane protein YfcA
VGAAFILVPVYLYLGIEIHTAMSTALLLNGISMLFASITFAREKLILWRLAFPIIVFASLLAPVGAYVSQYVPRSTLLFLFVLFLLFAATMMLFYKPANAAPKTPATDNNLRRVLTLGLPLGGIAGFVGGLLGVGGGNIIVPALIWLGIPPKNASATTSLIVMFSSFAGFAGHVSVGSLNYSLLSYTIVGSVGGALLGAWLMSRKLQNKHVKLLIGVLLYLVAGKLLFDLWR